MLIHQGRTGETKDILFSNNIMYCMFGFVTLEKLH